MGFAIFLLVAFLTAACSVDATQLFGKDVQPKTDSLLARPNVIKDFKNILYKALDAEGTYQRNLLVTAGIVPAPPGYESQKEEEKILSSEMRDHFNNHIKEILKSLDKLDYALDRLFGERLSSSLADIANSKLNEHLKSDWADLSNVSEENSLEESSINSSDVDCYGETKSQSEACKDSLAEVPELPSLPEVDFAMSESELDSGEEFVTSTVVDTITTEYVKLFSEIPEASKDFSTAGQFEASTLTPLDDDFIMHVMSTSIPPDFNDIEESSEKEIKLTTESLSTVDTDSSDYSKTSEDESDSVRVKHIFGRVLTFEEVKLLDQSLSLKPELKYQVISTSQPDEDTLSNIHFFTNDENSSFKLISKKRRRVNPRDISLDEPIFYQAPTPQKMILRYYRDIPDTSFTCENKSLPGFYADQETDCQVFHVCWPGRRESFLCPVGSLFNQRVLSCDNFNKTNCSLSHAYFDINTAFQEFDDAKAHNVTPSPDPMMRPIENDSGTTEVVARKADIVELFEADLHFSEMINKTSITELWDYLPVKAKVFVYPEPADLKKFLEEHHHHHKIRKSKDVRGLESSTEREESAVEILDDVLEKRQRIEANIVRVLKKLSRKHRD